LSARMVVTGGAGFIGSCFVLQWLAEKKYPVVVLGKPACTSIVDAAEMRRILEEQRSCTIGSGDFIYTHIEGSFQLLRATQEVGHA